MKIISFSVESFFFVHCFLTLFRSW